MEITGRVISGEWAGMEEKVQGIRSINGRYKIDREVKDSIRNGEAEELICTTHGHELRGVMLVGGGIQGRGELRGGKNWTTVIA